jgi:hypothetical protein
LVNCRKAIAPLSTPHLEAEPLAATSSESMFQELRDLNEVAKRKTVEDALMVAREAGVATDVSSGKTSPQGVAGSKRHSTVLVNPNGA